MELQVFSDPLWGVGREEGVPYDELESLTRYDEEILKPSLLLADRVTLRTWRLDMQTGQRIEAAAVRLGVPLAANIRLLVYGQHEGARERLGISRELLADLRLVLDLYDHSPLPSRQFFESKAVAEFVRLWVASHRSQFDALAGRQFEALVDEGVLVEKPWDDRSEPMNFPQARWTHRYQSFDYGWEQMLGELQSGSSAMLLDRGIDGRMKQSHLEIVQPSTITLSNATELMQMIDGLSQATLDEVIDVRRAVADHIQPFRSFIFQQARGMDSSPDTSVEERQRQAALTWETDVSPAVEDLRGKIETDAYLRQMIHAAAHGPEGAIGVGLGIVTALATGGLGVTALAGLGVAALPTIIKAAAASHEAKKNSRSNGAYLIVEVERRLATQKRDGA